MNILCRCSSADSLLLWHYVALAISVCITAVTCIGVLYLYSC